MVRELCGKVRDKYDFSKVGGFGEQKKILGIQEQSETFGNLLEREHFGNFYNTYTDLYT